MLASVFLELVLPNATTWFYFSLLLAIAVFFKFNRVLSLRNWDMLALFMLVPGLLLIQDGRDSKREARQLQDAGSALVPAAAVAPLMADAGAAGLLPAAIAGGVGRQRDEAAKWLVWTGYACLLAASAFWLVRCVVDLALERRPALTPNLNSAGLTWLAGALFISLGVVAVRPPLADGGPVGPQNAVVTEAQEATAKLVQLTRFWVERGFAGACHLAIVAALIVIGARHFGDPSAGIAAAAMYLLLPYTALHVAQVQYVLPAALMLWAVVLYRSPPTAGALFGIAAGSFFFPAAAVPVWLNFYRGRGAGRFFRAFAVAAGASLGLAGMVLWLNGQIADPGWRLPIGLPRDWRFWRPIDVEGFWTGVHWAYRIPVFIGFVVFVAGTAVWPAPKNLAHVLALSAATLIGVQLWYADRGGEYVLWYLPMLLLVVFRPNLSDRHPPAPMLVRFAAEHPSLNGIAGGPASTIRIGPPQVAG